MTSSGAHYFPPSAFRHKGGSAPPTVIYQTVPGPTPQKSAPVATPAATAVPPPRADAAKRVSGAALAATNQRRGRMSTILAPRGTLEDQVKSLLGG